MSAPLRLDSTYVPGDGAGTMRLRLVNAGQSSLAGFRLALTSVVQLTSGAGGAELVVRTSGYSEVAPPTGFELAPGGVWELGRLRSVHPSGHANDGPASAFVILADGSTMPVFVARTAAAEPIRVGTAAPPPLRLADGGDIAVRAWATAAACERRLYPDDAAVLGEPGGDAVTASLDTGRATESFVIDGGEVAAGSEPALVSAFLTLADARRRGVDPAGVHEPIHGWRGLHVDLARQFLPAVDVDWLIDAAAWRRLNRLHLHLTDDEAWRVPIAAYPALTEVGAWRGHGLAIPPLLGSGPEPYGGVYTAEDIRGWVERAAGLGLELVPEVDLPAHCFAALAAVPALRDPDDSTGAVSAQGFVDNVLVPGLPSTGPFLEDVFGELADLFPGPWLHLGGDEVPNGAWAGSPAAQAYARERELGGTEAIAAAFMGDVIQMVKTATGRRVGVWQEAAESRALRPDDGYVVGWRSSAACRRLAAAGYAVVAAPAEVYYLDIAADAEWPSPGASWAGHTTLADIEAYDVTAGWTETERSNLLGIQACLWTEHVHDRATLEELLIPRLDAIATSAWTRIQSR